MQIFERFWHTVTYIFGITTLSPLGHVDFETPHSLEALEQIPLRPLGDLPSPTDGAPGPIFKPPGGDGSSFTCNYTKMTGFTLCSPPGNRSCWLTNNNGIIWDIGTDYEGTTPKGEALMPSGTVRAYTLTVTEDSINADGLNFTDGKWFNGQYPGPLIQACWGDLVEVTVINQLPYNGTSLHWHGLRQWLSMHMDGVNGITQCPIPPNSSFTYRFNATQYGSSWYHSHYSLQYADGMIGPIVSSRLMLVAINDSSFQSLYGPTSSQYDEAAEPLLITDWSKVAGLPNRFPCLPPLQYTSVPSKLSPRTTLPIQIRAFYWVASGMSTAGAGRIL